MNLFLVVSFHGCKEGHVLKLEKFWPTFASFNAMVTKIKKIL